MKAARAARAAADEASRAGWRVVWRAKQRGPSVEDAPASVYFPALSEALSQAAALDLVRRKAADARAASAAAEAAGRAEQQERAALEAAREAERDAQAAWGRAAAAVRELA